MESAKSLDIIRIITSLLHDAHLRFGVVFNTRSLRLTKKLVERRYRLEGAGFLTKTLRRLGKRLDQALAGAFPLTAVGTGFKPSPLGEFPIFLGEFFAQIFHPDGTLLPDPNASCVAVVREILACFGKYKLPYSDEQEQSVIDAFKRAEDDLTALNPLFAELHSDIEEYCRTTRRTKEGQKRIHEAFASPNPDLHPSVPLRSVVREARIALATLFSSFDPTDITPSHGPGAVATKQQRSAKFVWRNVSNRITSSYPFDAYFCASTGHVCDTYDKFSLIGEADLPARVILVPKDSRGPRLISCEPVDFQWVQQGLGRAIVSHVESHPITRWNVFFTDQKPNQRGALLGSSSKRYVTLDLKEASDRVHTDLVRLLFPSHLYRYLESCRSLSTELPNKQVLTLKKYAPMGSALCFPVMALTIWSLLYAGAPDADTRDGILVYGDDVIVPAAYAVSAMNILESFGLKINRDKSCIQGSFRESCGVDAFNGINVTPVYCKTVWKSSPSPDVYCSWIAYANSFYDRQCYTTYDYIVGCLAAVYGAIPDDEMSLTRHPSLGEFLPCERYPRLRVAPHTGVAIKRRFNSKLQKFEYKVRCVSSPSVHEHVDGWSMLLRYFTESQSPPVDITDRSDPFDVYTSQAFDVSLYTKRKTSMLVNRWR